MHNVLSGGPISRQMMRDRVEEGKEICDTYA